jgi:hypothetical protein
LVSLGDESEVSIIDEINSLIERYTFLVIPSHKSCRSGAGRTKGRGAGEITLLCARKTEANADFANSLLGTKALDGSPMFNAYITTCSLQSVQLGLHNLIPVICIPTFPSQMEVAYSLERTQAGLITFPNTTSAALKISNCLRRMWVSRSEYFANAMRVGYLLHSSRGLDQVIETIALAGEGNSYLSSWVGHHLENSYYQTLYNLEFVIICVIFSVLLFLILSLIPLGIKRMGSVLNVFSLDSLLSDEKRR